MPQTINPRRRQGGYQGMPHYAGGVAGGGGPMQGGGNSNFEFVGASSSIASTTTGTLTITLPADYASGQLCIVHVTHDLANAVTPPAGWGTLVNSSNSNRYEWIFYKILEGSDGPTVDFTVGTPIVNGVFGVAYCYRNTNLVVPVYMTVGTNATATSVNGLTGYVEDDANLVAQLVCFGESTLPELQTANGYTLDSALATSTATDAAFGLANQQFDKGVTSTVPTWQQADAASTLFVVSSLCIRPFESTAKVSPVIAGTTAAAAASANLFTTTSSVGLSLQAGDVIYVGAISIGANPPVVSGGTNITWTQIGTTQTSGSYQARCYRGVVTGAIGSTIVVTSTSASAIEATGVVVRGADTTTPEDISVASTTTAAALTVDLASAGSTVTEDTLDLVFALGTNDNGSGGSAFSSTVANYIVRRNDGSANSSDSSVLVCYRQQPTTGAQEVATITQASALANVIGFRIAVRPAA